MQLRRAPTRYEPRAPWPPGMAEVWRGDAVFEDGARHPVAIKRVLPNLASQELYRSMFEDEARLGMALSHANIVRVYDARDVGGTFLMIMELVDGTSLKDLLARAHQREAPMPVATALHIARELAKALDYAHTATDAEGTHLGVVHRDVSPHNLLLGRRGEVKLADFGLADASVHQTHLGDGMLGGKLGYLAPEIVRAQPATHRIDLFALGIVLWEMLSGRRLLPRRDRRRHHPGGRPLRGASGARVQSRRHRRRGGLPARDPRAHAGGSHAERGARGRSARRAHRAHRSRRRPARRRAPRRALPGHRGPAPRRRAGRARAAPRAGSSRCSSEAAANDDPLGATPLDPDSFLLGR
ncbi:MAG: serine/threonine protein kinase [Sandaracinaceae bacterium]|nr:serine/threonine protein kinase [Sandaracinaceae bacterium]